MHASFSFHHSNLQLAYTTQARNFNLKTYACKQTYVMHIQMHQTSLLVCSPTCVLQILINPLRLSILSYLCISPLIFVNYFSPLSSKTKKGALKFQIVWGETMLSEEHFPKFGSTQITCKRYLTQFDPMASFFTPHFKGYLDHVELNTYSSFARLNTRFTSPQTCHMLPLDHFKHTSNSGTIQALNSFDFHEPKT